MFTDDMRALSQQFEAAHKDYAAGRLLEAEKACRKILGLEPRHAESLHLLGVIAHVSGQPAAARKLISNAIAIKPREADFHNSLGNVCSDIGDFEEATRCYAQAMSLRPNFADAYYNLGNCYAGEEQLQQAEVCYRAALQMRPHHAASWINLGNVFRSLGRLREALECYRQVSGDASEYAEAQWNEAIARLLMGDYRAGWELYEWRWKLERAKSRGREFVQPLWDGGDLAGRRLLVYSEQGFGDTIQFARYLPLAKERGATIIFECPGALKRLFEGAPGADQVVATGESLPPFDLHVPLLSLPRIFGTTLESIPQPLRLVARSNGWKIAEQTATLRVGLAWAGGTSDAKRDCPLKLFAPLGGRRDIVFYSLQKGPAAAQAKEPPHGMVLHDCTSQLNDFAETAALMNQLDLLICTDTAVAHLGGTLGKPTWVLLRYAADWRWLRARDDNPWYPTVRLFRQDRPCAWEKPMHEIAYQLSQFADARRP